MTLDSLPNRRTVLTAGSALMFGAALSPWELRAQTSSGKPIGTIGAGYIGSTIGGLWVKNGHKVLFSSRHPEELRDLVSGLGPLAQAGTVDQAIAFGDVVLLTVPYGAVPQIGRDYATQLNRKIVLDTCNAGPVTARLPMKWKQTASASLRRSTCRERGSFVPSTRCPTKYSPAKRTGPIRNSRYLLPVTIRRPSGWPRRLCATPVSILWSSASSPTPSSFSTAGRVTGSKSARPN
jgi:hypothetical protein